MTSLSRWHHDGGDGVGGAGGSRCNVEISSVRLQSASTLLSANDATALHIPARQRQWTNNRQHFLADSNYNTESKILIERQRKRRVQGRWPYDRVSKRDDVLYKTKVTSRILQGHRLLLLLLRVFLPHTSSSTAPSGCSWNQISCQRQQPWPNHIPIPYTLYPW